MTPDHARPHWERGYRCHGYWLGLVRLGLVSLGPARCTLAARDGYQWEYFPGGVVAQKPAAGGTVKTLREGRRLVEAAHAAREAARTSPP